MTQTQLEHYKKQWECKHDGEAVIKAANNGFFPLFWGGDSEAQPCSSATLRRLGIESTMNRDEIIILISDLLLPDNINVKRLFDDEFSQKSVTESEAERRSVELTRERLHFILGEVVRFCEFEIEDEIKSKIDQK